MFPTLIFSGVCGRSALRLGGVRPVTMDELCAKRHQNLSSGFRDIGVESGHTPPFTHRLNPIHIPYLRSGGVKTKTHVDD